MACKLRIRILILTSIFIACGIFSFSQNNDEDSNSHKVQQFATEFYDWYMKAYANSHRFDVILAAKELGMALTPELLQALKQDREAQLRDESGYIVGLDFDPFLAVQDPCDRYEVRKVVKRGESY